MKQYIIFLLLFFPLVGISQERRLNLEVLTGVPSGNIYLSYEQVYAWKTNQSLGFRVGAGWTSSLLSNM